MKTYGEQFKECKNTNVCVLGEHQKFSEHPELLPAFPSAKFRKVLREDSDAGIRFYTCNRFGGNCSSKNEECKQMRSQINSKKMDDF